MKSGGQKIQRFLASLESALLASEKEPAAVADVEQFIAVLNELGTRGLPGAAASPGRKLPVCRHWQSTIEATLDRPSWKMAQALDEIRIEPLHDTRNDATRRHMTDLLALITWHGVKHEETLPTFADGAPAQAVLEASLISQERWVEVAYATTKVGNLKNRGH